LFLSRSEVQGIRQRDDGHLSRNDRKNSGIAGLDEEEIAV
jgi:hypothetical protein